MIVSFLCRFVYVVWFVGVVSVRVVLFGPIVLRASAVPLSYVIFTVYGLSKDCLAVAVACGFCGSWLASAWEMMSTAPMRTLTRIAMSIIEVCIAYMWFCRLFLLTVLVGIKMFIGVVSVVVCMDSDAVQSSDASFDGSFGLIGDFHFMLSADEFRERLDLADVIFFEYPDSEIENAGFVNSVRNGYEYGGLLMAIASGIMFVNNRLFARGSLVYVLLNEYREKLYGVEGSEERSMYLKAKDDVGFVKFGLMLFLLVIVPRRFIMLFLEKVALRTSGKESDESVVAEDYHAMLSDDGERTEGMDERDEAMVENIESYLAEHPSVDDVVLVVGMAHAASIIRLLVENGVVGSETIELLNEDVSSEFLRESSQYNTIDEDFFEL